MEKGFVFHYFIQELDALARARSLVEKIMPGFEQKIYDRKDQIDCDTKNGVFIIDGELDFFLENISSPEKQNIVIVINDILNDLEEYPYEIYISRNRVITSLSAVLFDLKNSSSFSKDYFCVELVNIALSTEAPCDLYLKINDDKFLKVHKKGDFFDEDVVKRYQEKSKFLWVKRQHFFLFGDFLYGQDDLEQNINTPFNIENLSHLQLLHDMARSCGITEKTTRAVVGSVDRIKENAGKKLKSLMDQFEEAQGSFLYFHSYFTSLVAVEIASRQKWFRPQHLDKLVLAAMIHDLGYIDKDCAIYENLPKSKLKDLDPEKKEDVLGHIDRLLEQLHGNDDIDSDVLNIIKFHHGGRGEESYPNISYATEMDLLSGIFLLSHVFTISFFKVSFRADKIPKILAYMRVLYNKGNLKQILPDFEKDVANLLK